jgi:hypothetical protein
MRQEVDRVHRAGASTSLLPLFACRYPLLPFAFCLLP